MPKHTKLPSEEIEMNVSPFAEQQHAAADQESESINKTQDNYEQNQDIESDVSHEFFQQRRKSATCLILLIIGTFTIFGLLLMFMLTQKNSNKMVEYSIGFGSCTSYDIRDQPIWTTGVIPSAIDAWIWVGDIAYLDDPSINCQLKPESSQCECESDWLVASTSGCMAGDIDYARERYEAYLSNDDYLAFLEYMCPGSFIAGYFPPPGTNKNICPKPILGIYDDHDFGYNNANHRLSDKQTFKLMYLDAIGESATSIRRSDLRGAWDKHSLTPLVDVFLLDERYDRDPLPCWTHRPYCTAILQVGPKHSKYTWCYDFLNTSSESGNIPGIGSCCMKDELLYLGWCQSEYYLVFEDNELKAEACDPTHDKFGSRMIYLVQNQTVITTQRPDNEWLDNEQSTPMCEVLGKTQRKWLRESLTASEAKIKLIVSPSVVLSNPIWQSATVDGVTIPEAKFCSGDDLDCYSAAQAELLTLTASSTQDGSCTLLLVGDFHWTDIKVMNDKNDAYNINQFLPENIYSNNDGIVQIMSSGLTESTSPNVTCEEFYSRGYTLDPLNLREKWTSSLDDDACPVIVGGSFATIHVTSEEDIVKQGIKQNDKLIKVEIKLRDRNGVVKHVKTLNTAACTDSSSIQVVNT